MCAPEIVALSHRICRAVESIRSRLRHTQSMYAGREIGVDQYDMIAACVPLHETSFRGGAFDEDLNFATDPGVVLLERDLFR